MQFRPCIDIHDGKVKQIVGSSLSDQKADTNFVADKGSEFYASLYKEHSLKGGHVIILNKIGTPEYEASKKEALKALNTYPEGLQIGGGITDANSLEFIENNASHVIVTSYLFENDELSFERMKRLKDKVSKEKIVFDLSCKKVGNEYFVTCNRWQTVTKTVLNADMLCKLEDYCDEYLIHAVDVEGKCNGPETDIIKELSHYKGNKITYAGGIHSYEDIEMIKKTSDGRIDFTIGSALDIFGGNLEFLKVAKYR